VEPGEIPGSSKYSLFVSEGDSQAMFKKAQIDALFGELDQQWRGKPEFEKLSRDIHLGIALSDAGREFDKIDARAVALIQKHKPKG